MNLFFWDKYLNIKFKHKLNMQKTNLLLTFLNVFDRLEKDPSETERTALIDALKYDIVCYEDADFNKINHKLNELQLYPSLLDQYRLEIVEFIQNIKL